jgi:anti-anti-sigma factor
LLNFEGVNYLSSTILARLINLARFAQEHRAKLKLCGLRPDIEDIFRITRLEGFFEMYPSQEGAIGAF